MNITLSTKNDSELYNSFQYVRLATNKNDHRPMCTCVHYREGILLGTDGHRLHTATIRLPELENGAYSIIKLNKREIILEREPAISVPDRAWNFTTPEKKAVIVHGTYPISAMDSANVYRLIAKLGIIDINNRDHGYNYTYLADALFFGADKISRNPGGLLIIETANHAAAIMIMRL